MNTKAALKSYVRASAQTSILIGLLAISLTWLGIFSYLAEQKDQAQAAAVQNVNNLTIAFEQQIVNAIRDIDQALLFVRAQYADDPAHFNIDTWSKNSYFTKGIAVQLALIGSDGYMISSNVAGNSTARVDLRDREHFQFQLHNPEDELFISKPVLGRVTHKWTIQLTRKVLGADGSFAGVLVASLDPYYLSRIYDSFDLGSGGSIMLLGTDGFIRAMDGLTSESLGKSLVGSRRFKVFASKSAGDFINNDAQSGSRKLVAFRHVRNLPLIVTTTLDEAEILKSYYANGSFLTKIGWALTLLIAAAMIWSVSQRVRLDAIRRELVEKSRMLGLTLSNMDEGILMVDGHGQVVVLNTQARRLLEIPDNWSCPFPGSDLPFGLSERDELRRALESDRALPLKISEVTTGSGRVLEIHRVDLPNGGYVETIADRTRDRNIQRDLVEARDRAEEASRVRAAFLATMSHEIRTPLGSVISMADLLSDTSLDRDQRWYTRIARESAEHLLLLLDDILDISKFETGQLKLESISFDLPLLIQNGVEMFAKNAHDKGLAIATHLDPTLPKHIMGDPGRLRQIVINLIGNAVKFTDMGHVLVRVGRSVDAKGNSCVKVNIEDTGIGISVEGQQRLFEDFRQVDASINRRFGGTGLGLSICKKLALKMGGSIGVQSKIGEGAVFTVTLPLEMQAGENEPALTSLPAGCVAVVGGGQFERDVLADQVASCGARVRSFPDLNSATAWLDLNNGLSTSPIAILLGSDEIDSLVLSQRSLGVQDVRSILIGTAEQGIEEMTVKSTGYDRWLISPVSPDLLVEAVRILMQTDRVQARNLSPLTVVEPESEAMLRLRILLAEDNVTNQFAIKHILSKLGASSVVVVGNGLEAVKAVQTQTFDLVLMDMMMPVMDGLAATRAIRCLSGPASQIPIVALTANAFPEDREATRLAGMNAFTTKPTTRARLRSAIQEVLPIACVGAPAASTESKSGVVNDDFDATMFSCLQEELGDAQVDEALQMFFSDSNERFRRLENADASTVRQECHAMKSSAAMFGLSGFSRECQKIERLASKGEAVEASDLTRLLNIFNEAQRLSVQFVQTARAS